MIIDCHTHFWRYPGELTEASMKLGEAVYKDMQQKEQPKKQSKTEEKKKNDKDIKENVVDAEFEDVTPVDKNE